MLVRLIIAKVIHTRYDEFQELVKTRWAPLFEEHGGKFLGLFRSIESTEHEVVGMMRFDSREHLQHVMGELANDDRFRTVNQRMRPMLQSNDIHLLEPV